MKVLIVVARRYNGHELWVTLGTLQERGHTFEVISTETTIADEVTLQRNIIERTINDVDPSEIKEFDALMIISGNMKDTELYWTHKRVLAYVDEVVRLDYPLAAICCSVPTIRAAVDGKKVSYYPLHRSRDILRQAGATLQNIAMTVDGKLVTAEHQMATQMWIEAFCGVLEGREPPKELTDSGFVPHGRERKPIPEIERLKPPEKRTPRRAPLYGG